MWRVGKNENCNVTKNHQIFSENLFINIKLVYFLFLVSTLLKQQMGKSLRINIRSAFFSTLRKWKSFRLVDNK